MTFEKTKQCKKYETKMDLYICDALPEADRSKLEDHIKTCAACARTFSKIKEAYAFIASGTEKVPTPDWDTQWRVIRKRVLAASRPKEKTVPGFRWGWAMAGAMVIFVMGVFVGKYMFFSPTEDTVTDSRVTRQLHLALQEHIETIKPVILQYSNYHRAAAGGQGISVDIVIDREMAAKFLAKNRLLQGQMLQNKNQYMKQLLEELDMILMEISNLTTDEPENLLLIKELIKIKGILLKMEVFRAPQQELRKI